MLISPFFFHRWHDSCCKKLKNEWITDCEESHKKIRLSVNTEHAAYPQQGQERERASERDRQNYAWNALKWNIWFQSNYLNKVENENMKMRFIRFLSKSCVQREKSAACFVNVQKRPFVMHICYGQGPFKKVKGTTFVGAAVINFCIWFVAVRFHSAPLLSLYLLRHQAKFVSKHLQVNISGMHRCQVARTIFGIRFIFGEIDESKKSTQNMRQRCKSGRESARVRTAAVS